MILPLVVLPLIRCSAVMHRRPLTLLSGVLDKTFDCVLVAAAGVSVFGDSAILAPARPLGRGGLRQCQVTRRHAGFNRGALRQARSDFTTQQSVAS